MRQIQGRKCICYNKTRTNWTFDGIVLKCPFFDWKGQALHSDSLLSHVSLTHLSPERIFIFLCFIFLLFIQNWRHSCAQPFLLASACGDLAPCFWYCKTAYLRHDAILVTFLGISNLMCGLVRHSQIPCDRLWAMHQQSKEEWKKLKGSVLWIFMEVFTCWTVKFLISSWIIQPGDRNKSMWLRWSVTLCELLWNCE